ncbi:DUF1850 domain-containing protein [Lolliginicoccus suaedae]|uniref:DUF1850 domain-containing protein n=1 Tax=Lolliginicoccus suaedae TaxID=2605429 RepID=UPI0011F09A70|nr:DUF1850 domain-containing protein [Lolliginicoccus suaedae]
MTSPVRHCGGIRSHRVPPHRALLALMLGALASLAGGACASPEEQLRFEVYSHETDEVVYSAPLSPGEPITLDHIHSVHKRPVHEVFSVNEEGELTMREMVFDRIGANLPGGPETIGGTTTTFLVEDGRFRVLHHDRPLGIVPMIVGNPSVDHTITVPDGTVVRLLDLVRAGARVDLRTNHATTTR